MSTTSSTTQDVAVEDVGVEILEQPHRALAAGRVTAVAGELDEVHAVHDGQRPREIRQEHEARLERGHQHGLAPHVVDGDLRGQLLDARMNLLCGEVDVADPRIGVRVGRFSR